MSKPEIVVQFVRPFCTVIGFGAIIFAFIWSVIHGKVEMGVAEVLGLVGPIVGYWFSQRQTDKTASNGSAPAVPPTTPAP